MLNHLNISKSKWAIFSPIVDFRLSLSLKTSRLSTRNSHPLGIPRRFQKLCFGDHEWLWTASLRRSSHGSPGELRGRHQSLWSEKYQKRLYSLPDTFWEKYMYIYNYIYYVYVFVWTPSKQNHLLRMFGNPGNIWVIHMLAWIWAMKNTPVPFHEILVGW